MINEGAMWKVHGESAEGGEQDNITTCEMVEGPCELIRRDEILKALRVLKKGKAAGPTGIVGNVYG